MREAEDSRGFKPAQLALVLPDKKIKYQKFVKSLFDLEALKADLLKGDQTFLSTAPLRESQSLNEKERFLEQSFRNSTRVIRKIDKNNQTVENRLRAVITAIAAARKSELFYLNQIKRQRDVMVQTVYLSILKLTDFSESNQRREQFSLSE